jgi:putative DNA primase/helicase
MGSAEVNQGRSLVVTNIYTPSRISATDNSEKVYDPNPMRFGPIAAKQLDGEREEYGKLYFIFDRDAAERFLTALDPKQIWHTFQVFDDDYDRKDEELGRILDGSLKLKWDALCRFQKKGAGAFVTVNVTDGAGRKKDNITNVRGVFVDLDGEPLPATFHVKPHIIVESSPGRWHVYFLVKDCPLDQFESIQKRLIKHYKSDPRIHDLPRVMRLPGLFHQKVKDGKRSMPFRSRLVEAHSHDPYTVEQVTERLPTIEDPKPKSNGADKQSGAEPWTAAKEAWVRSALDAIPADVAKLKAKLGDEFDTHLFWVNVGRALYRTGWGESARMIWRDWSAQCKAEFNETQLNVNWRSFSNTEDSKDKVTIGTIVYHARQFGWIPEEEKGPDNAPAFSEEAIAIDLANQHTNSLRYVAKWNQWFCWDGTCWREDEKRSVFTIARGICRETASTVNKASERKRIASAKTRAAVVSLAGEDPRLAATVDQWDTDPWLLCTPNGTVDLRTGAMREHRPDDYVTKMAAVSPGGDCPKWKKFMDEVTATDKDLQGYLQRVGGYCLTGITREQELYFFYGTGRNGKSVFLKTIATILGDYHRASSIETFTVSQSERHPTEVAGLRGARLVTATETEDGRRWAEARIKELTGGDKVTARFMRQDFFDFTPQFKLLFSGNHMPALRTVNQAISRRFRRVPFTVTIPEERVNVHLGDELMEEAPGILAWLIEGCLAWQSEGLNPPKAVAEATQSYFDSQDVFGDWLAECCDVGGNYTEASARLFGEWKHWAETRNEFVGSKKAFGQKLEDHGFVSRRDGRARRFSGLRVKP